MGKLIIKLNAISQAISGNNTHGVIESTLMQAGLSETNAELVDSLISIGNVAGKAGAVANVARLRQAQLVEMGEVAWTKSAKFSSKAYGYVMSNRVNIGGHALNVGLGGALSYMSAIVTGSEHPIRDTVIGTTVGMAFSVVSPRNRSQAMNVGAISSGTSNAIGQMIDRLGKDNKPLSLFKVATATYSGALTSGLTYGMPVVSSTIIGFGPGATLGVLGDAVYDKWHK